MQIHRTNGRGPGISTKLIAPCGINCRLCRAFGRKRNPCPGCLVEGGKNSMARTHCHIKNCSRLKSRRSRFCVGCNEFPCFLILRLDKRYQLNYGVSPIANLRRIKEKGIRKFVAEEAREWACPTCGTFLCMHEPLCLTCRFRRREK
jgi:hypothetical protein